MSPINLSEIVAFIKTENREVKRVELEKKVMSVFVVLDECMRRIINLLPSSY